MLHNLTKVHKDLCTTVNNLYQFSNEYDVDMCLHYTWLKAKILEYLKKRFRENVLNC